MEERITLKTTPGARQKKQRVGRGIGSNRGSTCGRGDKGQNSRSGGGVRPGFEGGQMPVGRRLPKRGFHSRSIGLTAEVRLNDLQKFPNEVVNLELLKSNGVIPKHAQKAKVIASGSLDCGVTVKGLAVTAGARKAIEAASGSIEE